MNVNDVKKQLVSDLGLSSKIKGIGQTGDINAPLIQGNSDIDMFVLCTEIPTPEERTLIYQNYSSVYSDCWMNVCNGGIWGYGDILVIDGIDVMFMYFTIEEMVQYLDEVLAGKHLDRDGGFYPTGRLSSVENINVLYESKDEWKGLINHLKEHPKELFQKLFDYHIANVLNDEDLGRVLLRKEVLFYHSVLESAIDHLLQALFAANRTYFPSRKRSEQYIEKFQYKPKNCYERLMQIIQDSVSSNTIEASVAELKAVTLELRQLNTLV